MNLKLLQKKFSNLVKIDYNQLQSVAKDSQLNLIKKAYGVEGLGIMIIQNVPNLGAMKSRLFNDGHKLVNLPPSTLTKLEHPEQNYAYGWSYGKEYLGEKPDFYKASYYANLRNLSTKSEHKENIWPSQDIPTFKPNFYELGDLIRNMGLTVLTLIDSYIKAQYPLYKLSYPTIISESDNNVGRFLYYYPRNKFNVSDNNVWCEWHNDHSSLTGLVSASYIKEDGQKADGLSLTKTGLYIQARSGKEEKVTFGPDDLAFQLGETLQIHSGGLLHATPHAVRVDDDIPGDVARCTFALFMAPDRHNMLDIPEGSRVEDIVTSEIYKVPKIQNRFKVGMNYGEFNDETYRQFYNK
jgi:isopenicillin N synthase-like dioxygenase